MATKGDPYRNSLAFIGWTEEQIIEYDKRSWENHLYRPTRSERSRPLDAQIESRRPARTIKSTTLILLKRKENAKDYTTNIWQRLNKNIEPFLVVNKYDSDEDKFSKDTKNTTTVLILELVGGSIKSRRATCSLRPRQQIWIEAIGRREAGTLGIVHGLTIREIFSEFRTSFGWPGETSRQPTGGVHRHTSHMTCLCTSGLSAQISHACIHTSREHAWLKHNKVSQK